MLNTDFSQIKSISSLPRQYNEYVTLAKTKGSVVFLRHSQPEVVLVDLKIWQKLEELKQQEDTRLALASIKQSENEYKKGQAKRLKSLKEI